MKKYITDRDLQSEMEQGYIIGSPIHGGYSLSREGKHIADFREYDDVLAFIVEDMERQRFWPNVFFVNDHGNVDLLQLRVKKGVVEERVLQSWV